MINLISWLFSFFLSMNNGWWLMTTKAKEWLVMANSKVEATVAWTWWNVINRNGFIISEWFCILIIIMLLGEGRISAIIIVFKGVVHDSWSWLIAVNHGYIWCMWFLTMMTIPVYWRLNNDHHHGDGWSWFMVNDNYLLIFVQNSS